MSETAWIVVPDVRHDHGGWPCLVRGKWRCTYCGHRLASHGAVPASSRRLPPWTWHRELIDRHRARARRAYSGTI